MKRKHGGRPTSTKRRWRQQYFRSRRYKRNLKR
jgi:hypothetical protein